MKIFSIVAVACMAAVSQAAPFYYQPNGVFMPISLSVPAVIQPQQQPQQQQQQQQQPAQIQAQSIPSTGSSSAANVSPWSIISTSLFGQKKDQVTTATTTMASKASAQVASKDDTVAMLTQILKPLKFVAASFLNGLEFQLEKTDSKKLANVLRGPIADLKNQLKSVWPTVPESSDSSSSTKGKAPSNVQQQGMVVAKSASFNKH